MVELVGEADSPQRLRLVLSWVVNDADICRRGAKLELEVAQASFHICICAALHEVLIHILDALQLILLLTLLTITIIAFPIIIIAILIVRVSGISVKKVEKLDESIVRHLFPRVTFLLSLCLDIIVLVIFIVPIVSLIL